MASDSDRDHVVRSDMERIFRGAGRRFLAAAPEGGVRPRGRMRWLRLAAPTLALASAIGLATTGWRAERAVNRRPAEPPPIAAPPAAPIAVAVRPAPAPDPVPSPTASASPSRPATVAAAKARRTVTARAERAGRDRSRPRPRPRPSASAAAARAARPACPPGSRSDVCIYRDVTDADARLRSAYARATRAGVRTKDLAALRKRWVKARRISLDEPDETIRRYHGLADELDRMSGGGPARSARR